MHCVVNELGKGTLHKASTSMYYGRYNLASVDLGREGRWGGQQWEWANSALHCVLLLRGGQEQRGVALTASTPEPVCLYRIELSPVLAQKRGCKLKQS